MSASSGASSGAPNISLSPQGSAFRRRTPSPGIRPQAVLGMEPRTEVDPPHSTEILRSSCSLLHLRHPPRGGTSPYGKFQGQVHAPREGALHLLQEGGQQISPS